MGKVEKLWWDIGVSAPGVCAEDGMLGASSAPPTVCRCVCAGLGTVCGAELLLGKGAGGDVCAAWPL